jgi:ParB/RepB/Spo0J family partition protein
MAGQYRLRQVSPQEVRFSRQNPRGDSAEVINNDSTFEQLKDSVSQFGVLVPIVVHEKRGSDGKKYTLIDGERRLRAALATNVEKIPAHVASSEDIMGELVQAFHIHMLRKQWRPVATARALKLIQEEIKKRLNKQRSETELLEELQIKTGCTDNQLQDLRRGIQYSDNVLTDVDRNVLKWSHLVQFEASFVEQLEQHYPDLLKKLGKKQVRDVLVNKARKKIIPDTRALIENIVPIIKRATHAKEQKLVDKLLEQFVLKEELSPETVKLLFDKVFPPPRDQVELAQSVIDDSDLLCTNISRINANLIISFPKETKALQKSLAALKEAVGNKLRQLNRVMN